MSRFIIPATNVARGSNTSYTAGGGDDFAVAHQAGRCVMIVGGDAEDAHSAAKRLIQVSQETQAMGRLSLLEEFALFLKENKKLWLLPIVITLVLLGALLAFAQTSALAPFIYTVF